MLLMMTLSGSLNKPSVNKILIFLGILISLIGFLDATYLTITYFQGVLPTCSVVHGCEKVLLSSYAAIFSVPVALFGALYYLAIFVGLVAFLDTAKLNILRTVSLGTTIGLIASGYFFFLQLVVIEAWCQFCIVSLITSTLLFVVGMLIYRSLPKV